VKPETVLKRHARQSAWRAVYMAATHGPKPTERAAFVVWCEIIAFLRARSDGEYGPPPGGVGTRKRVLVSGGLAHD
jgi:hypothetical protein